MKKYYCDCCGKETGPSLNGFKIQHHMHPDNIHNLSEAYNDREGNRVSGMEKVIELCNKCYNDIVSKAINRFIELKSKI
jgi:hypothetical protein